jgi:hypothetical protein
VDKHGFPAKVAAAPASMVGYLVLGSPADAPSTLSLNVAPGSATIHPHRIEEQGDQQAGGGTVIRT